MPDETALQSMGVAGILLVLVVKPLLDYVLKKRANGAATPASSREVTELKAELVAIVNEFRPIRDQAVSKIADLHRWHSANDRGVMPWKNEVLASDIRKLTERFERLADKVEECMRRENHP